LPVKLPGYHEGLSTIVSHPHLPLATEYFDQESLQDVRDSELLRMMGECADWSVAMDEFRCSLVTPVALTLWRVLIREEIISVAAAQQRLVVEICVRAKNAASDGVHAPGEDMRPLDEGSGIRSSDESLSG
jgi:hypothetical protein